MKQLNIIPCPNKVEYLGGSVKTSSLNSESFSARLTDKLPEEGYILEVTEQGATATAGGERGAFYASQTLKQLEQLDICPCVRIEDAPAFEYRSFMLDCARHMTTVENIKKLIDAAALVKMNTMHWHLTDDQGWRVEIESHPELVSVGSRRPRSDFGQYHFGEEYSGFFTKEEIREVVAYADDNYIEVVPEFDMPGHTVSLLAAHPELSCTGKQIEVGTKQGIYDDILCAGNDDALSLVLDVLGEMVELFPGRYFHIGGDEAPKKRWKECPKCQSRIKSLGLKDEEELQGWFVLQAVDFLREHGKTAIVWNESLNSGMMPNDVIAQRWMDKKDRTVSFANGGGKIIVSEFYYYYCDYPYGMTPVKKTYGLDPCINGLTAEGRNNILGVECPIWTEYVRDFERLTYLCFPRFWAVAEAGWTQRENMDYQSFAQRFEALRPMLRSLGIDAAPKSAWNPLPLHRLAEIKKFFKGTVNVSNIRNAVNNNNA
ncbi:MAG: beta-N-acetylhexosaminidase [Acutalibacteraceae bacterium]